MTQTSHTTFPDELLAEISTWTPDRLERPPDFLDDSKLDLEACLAGKPRPPVRSRKPRLPTIATLIARAEKAGKAVASVTTPDGTTITFAEPEPEPASGNPWLNDLAARRAKR
jgi:hypothetical protein